MCRLLVEGMEAGGCGWSAQISGEIGNVQLDYDGTPMVTDCMTEREVSPSLGRCGSIGRGTTQITGPLDTAALIARESGRPIIWNALGADGAAQPARRVPSTRTARRSSGSPTSTRRKASASSRRRRPSDFVSEIHTSRTTTSWTSSRAGRRPCLGTVEEKIGKFADPERRPAHEGDPSTARGGLFGAPATPLTEIKVNWISSDAPNAQELKERYEGFTIGEIAAREGKHLIDAMLDIAVAGAAQGRLRHDDARDGPRRP